MTYRLARKLTGPVCILAGVAAHGCGPTETIIADRVNWIESLDVQEGEVSMSSAVMVSGEPLLKVRGKPTKQTVVRLGDAVELPCYNGWATWKLISANGAIAEFARHRWFWDCVFIGILHQDCHRVRVASYERNRPGAKS